MPEVTEQGGGVVEVPVPAVEAPKVEEVPAPVVEEPKAEEKPAPKPQVHWSERGTETV